MNVARHDNCTCFSHCPQLRSESHFRSTVYLEWEYCWTFAPSRSKCSQFVTIVDVVVAAGGVDDGIFGGLSMASNPIHWVGNSVKIRTVDF